MQAHHICISLLPSCGHRIYHKWVGYWSEWHFTWSCCLWKNTNCGDSMGIESWFTPELERFSRPRKHGLLMRSTNGIRKVRSIYYWSLFCGFLRCLFASCSEIGILRYDNAIIRRMPWQFRRGDSDLILWPIRKWSQLIHEPASSSYLNICWSIMTINIEYTNNSDCIFISSLSGAHSPLHFALAKRSKSVFNSTAWNCTW